ncbi:MAG: hypothetical protein HND49_04975 [Planctomycetes bacterium]|nr:hypothetical protein [Planctomycetota bacterium]
MIQYQSEERVGNTGEILTYEDLKQMERENVLAALPQTNWKVSGGGGQRNSSGHAPPPWHLISRCLALRGKKTDAVFVVYSFSPPQIRVIRTVKNST